MSNRIILSPWMETNNYDCWEMYGKIIYRTVLPDLNVSNSTIWFTENKEGIIHIACVSIPPNFKYNKFDKKPYSSIQETKLVIDNYITKKYGTFCILLTEKQFLKYQLLK